MDRDERLHVDRIRRQQLELAQPSRPPDHLGELEAVDEQDQDDRELRREQQHEHAPVERIEIEVVRQRRHPDEDRRRHLDQREEEHEAERAEADEVPREPEHRDQRDQRREPGFPRPVRILDDRAGERELLLAVRVEHAPVRAGETFVRRLPRLVDRLHDVVVELFLLRDVEPLAKEMRFVRERGLRGLAPVAVRRPADFADDHRLVGKALVGDELAHRAILAEHPADRILARHELPVRQDVHGDEVDVADQLGMALPCVERLGGRHRDVELRARAIEVADQLLRRKIAEQHGLVADDGAIDVVVFPAERDQTLRARARCARCACRATRRPSR